MKEKVEKSYPYFEGLVNKSITKYKVMAIVGGITLIIGIILSIVFLIFFSLDAAQSTPPQPNYVYLAFAIVGFAMTWGPGAALAGVGISCWIAMGVQQKVARKKLGLNNKLGGKENGKRSKRN